MSVHAISWVLKHSPSVGTERLCLLVLADYADEEGLSWPSIGRIAREMRVSDRTAQRAIRNLAAQGHIEVDPQAAPDSRIRSDRRPNAYRIVIPRGDNDVTPLEADGVTSSAPRGDIQRADGVTPVSPKPRTRSTKDPTPNPRKRGDALEVGFVEWWERYPRKIGKPVAQRRWRAARRTGTTVEQLHAGLDRWLPIWAARGEPDFVPHPSTWLNQRRFDDDPGPANVVEHVAFGESSGAHHERIERPTCAACDSTGWLESPHGVVRCPDCAAPAQAAG